MKTKWVLDRYLTNMWHAVYNYRFELRVYENMNGKFMYHITYKPFDDYNVNNEIISSPYKFELTSPGEYSTPKGAKSAAVKLIERFKHF